MCIPFALNNRAVSNVLETKKKWIGEVLPGDEWLYIDLMLVLIFGGIPWQVYFQRVLSAKTEKSAMYLSYIAAIGCFVAGIPPMIIGVVARSTGKKKRLPQTEKPDLRTNGRVEIRRLHFLSFNFKF
jgi:high affinity choline transporter 7